MRKRCSLLRVASSLHRAVRRRLRCAWRPTDIDGCVLWLRPSAGVSTTWSLVTRWRDRARGNAMEASAVAVCPLFVARSAALNQRPSIRFGGLGEHLESLRAIHQPCGHRGFSVFAVVSPALSDHAASLLCWSGWTADVGIDMGANSELLWRVESSYSSGVHLLPGRPYLIGLVFRATTATLHVNRSVARTITGVVTCDPGAPLPARLCLGGDAGSFHGELGDVVIYDHALAPDELDALSRGLLLHYGLLGSVSSAGSRR